MRKEYGKALRSLFIKTLKEYNLDLKEFEHPQALIMPGEIMYSIQINDLSCFVYLVPSQKEDKFTIDIGWSEENDYPVVNSRPS